MTIFIPTTSRVLPEIIESPTPLFILGEYKISLSPCLKSYPEDALPLLCLPLSGIFCQAIQLIVKYIIFPLGLRVEFLRGSLFTYDCGL